MKTATLTLELGPTYSRFYDLGNEQDRKALERVLDVLREDDPEVVGFCLDAAEDE